MTPRTGKTAESIFRSTTKEPLPSAEIATGRRPKLDESWKKVTVVLKDRQVVQLDRLAADIRETTGAAINRAEIIRALLDAVAAGKFNLTGVKTEADLKAVFAARLAQQEA